LAPRYRTLRDTVAWSYNLLEAAEQTLFVQLAVFVGGFCATDSRPVGPWQRLTHRDRTYAAKRFDEVPSHMTAGVNAIGYFFHPDDLTRWFRDQGCDVTVLSDEQSSVTAGRYLRLLATRPGS
jgi:hypothetical protein